MQKMYAIILLLLVIVVSSCTTPEESTQVIYTYPEQQTLPTAAVVQPLYQNTQNTYPTEAQQQRYTPTQRSSSTDYPTLYTIEVNELGARPSEIVVQRSEYVRLHFVATSEYNSRGIIVRSPYFSTKRLLAHDEDVVTLLTDNLDIPFSIYRYDSDKKLAEGRILVAYS